MVPPQKVPLFCCLLPLWEITVSAKEHLCEMWFSMRKSFQLNAFVHGENVRSSSFCCEGVFQLKADEDKHFCIISLLSFTLYSSISVNLNREKSLVHHPAARCGAQTATAVWSCHDSFTDEAGGGGKSFSLCARSPAICSFFRISHLVSDWTRYVNYLQFICFIYLIYHLS